MPVRFATFLAMLLTTSTAVAHDWDAKPIERPEYGSPFEAWEGWRQIAPTADGGALAFIGLIQRVESAVSFETVVVYRDKRPVLGSPGFFYDQDHAHWIGDCGSSKLRRTKEQQFIFGDTAPPPPVIISPGGAYDRDLFTPKPETILFETLNVACSYEYDSEAGVVPFAFAQDFFRRSLATQ